MDPYLDHSSSIITNKRLNILCICHFLLIAAHKHQTYIIIIKNMKIKPKSMSLPIPNVEHEI